MRTLFVDEAGSTGRNFADFSQPFLVYAGWMLDNEIIPEIKKQVCSILKRIECDGEIKGKNIFHSPINLQTIDNLFNYLMINNINPFYTVAEKRFCITLKMFDIFFDPNYNPNTDEEFFMKRRWIIAQIFYQWFSDPFLINFFKCYDKCDFMGIINLYPDIERIIKKHCPELVRFMKHSDIKRLCEDYAQDMKSPRMSSLNMPIFITLLRRVGNYAMDNCIVFDIICDESSLLRKDVGKMFNEIIEEVSCISSITQRNSHSEVMLMSSDILAYLIYKLFVLVYKSDYSNHSIHKIAKKVINNDNYKSRMEYQLVSDTVDERFERLFDN